MNFARFCRLNAGKYPDREFLIESYPSKKMRRTLTWSQFEDQTNRVAHYLADDCGIRKGDIVQHLLLNSLEWYVTYMAVLKIGAVISPLNFRFAPSDIKYACDVTRSKAFIVAEPLLSRIEPIMKELDYCRFYLCVGEKVPPSMKGYGEVVTTGDASPICMDVGQDDMAELMFTSGTTGDPKPVCHTHGTLFWIAIGNAITYSDGYSSVYLAPHPFYHSGTLFLSFPSFLAAGKILMPMELDPPNYLRSIADEGCTGGWNTVPTWSDLLSAVKSGSVDLADYDLSALRRIEIGAQPVPYSLIEDSKKIFPNLPVSNIYGITEGGGGGTINCYDEDIMRKPGSIGKATAFMEARIVDPDGNELPPGAVGELLLKGPRLMKEYAFNPQLTAKTITNGWLHTGDLAWKDEEGFIFFADRAKDLIIRGGENIFPAEIEDALRRHPKIEDAAVLGYPHPRLVEIVMAIVQVRQNERLSDREVIDFLRECGLAKYKWPEKFVWGDILYPPVKPKMNTE